MSAIVELISKVDGLKSVGGCTKEQIDEAQSKLDLIFPEEYKEYLEKYGVIRFKGVELCGLNIDGYLNVVEATEQEKQVNKAFPAKMFVIEDLGVDARLIVGDEKGNIYILQRDRKKLICSSFKEYIEKCMYR